MCYSKEVQLATSLIILASCAIFYFIYSRRYAKLRQAWLVPFLNNVLLVFACIGLHQLFEFLSVATGSQVVYKIGLLISLTSMFFLLRSLEALTNKRLYSPVALWIIAGVAAHAFLVPMSFEGINFYMRHKSVFIWAAVYMLLFIYWHARAFEAMGQAGKSKKTILLYLLSTCDISFILSLIYVIWSYFRFSANVCYDSPSIWCTFFVIQAAVIPFFLATLPFVYRRAKKEQPSSLRRTVLYLLVSLLVLILLILTLPFFNCLTWKFVFP